MKIALSSFIDILFHDQYFYLVVFTEPKTVVNIVGHMKCPSTQSFRRITLPHQQTTLQLEVDWETKLQFHRQNNPAV